MRAVDLIIPSAFPVIDVDQFTSTPDSTEIRSGWVSGTHEDGCLFGYDDDNDDI